MSEPRGVTRSGCEASRVACHERRSVAAESSGSGGGNRTHTGGEPHGILSASGAISEIVGISAKILTVSDVAVGRRNTGSASEYEAREVERDNAWDSGAGRPDVSVSPERAVGVPRTVQRRRSTLVSDAGRRTRTLCGVAVTRQPRQLSTSSTSKTVVILSNNAVRPGCGSLTSRRP